MPTRTWLCAGTRGTRTGDCASLVNYGAGDPVMPPQFATLFKPPRVPPLSGLYRVHDWNWSPSPSRARQVRR